MNKLAMDDFKKIMSDEIKPIDCSLQDIIDQAHKEMKDYQDRVNEVIKIQRI